MNWLYIGIPAVVIGVILGWRYRRSLFHDYAYDALLSFADEALGGVIGLDIGDLLAALLIYRGERSRIGMIPASIAAWEASNFFPLGLIPFLGTGLEYVLNLFPAASVLNLLFNKEDKANNYRQEFQDLQDAAEAIDVSLSADEADDAYEASKWIEAAHKYSECVRESQTRVRNAVRRRGTNVKNEAHRVLRGMSGRQTKQARRIRRAATRIDSLVEESRDGLADEDYKEAIVNVRTAEELLDSVTS